MSLRQFLWAMAPVITILGILSSGAARAGVSEDKSLSCDAACKAVIAAWVSDDAARFIPVQAEPVYRFDGPAALAACGVKRGPDPMVHAVVLAPFYRSFIELPGTQNDARLLKGYFTDRGVLPEFMRILDGDAVNRQRMLEAMDQTLPCVRERDQVVFVFTGGSASYRRWLKPDIADLLAQECADGGGEDEDAQALCAAMMEEGVEPDDSFATVFAQAIDQNDYLVHFSSEINVNLETLRTDENTRITGLRDIELSNFVTQVRNRGGDAFVVLDTNYAAANYLLQMQRDAQPDGGWAWNSADEEDATASDPESDLVPLYGNGQMAAFYAADANELAYESPSGGDRPVLGNFMFAFTESLRQQPSGPLTELATAVAKAMSLDQNHSNPVFEASYTGLRFLTLRSAPEPREQDIEVISPGQTRGATAVEGKTLEIIGRYIGAGKPSFANIDGEPVNVDGNGQFRKLIEDVTGKTAIQLRVYSPANEQLAARSINLGGGAAEEAAVAIASGRYALIVTNEDYLEDGFDDLATPKEDGDAIAGILTGRFGFKTTIAGEKSEPLDLRLENVTKAQLQKTLFELRRRLTAEDQLIIYYAGHGENDPDLGAYWVPVDGQPKADFTWIAAEEITRELKRMNAQSILVISDSCYAGGLSRGGEEEKPAAGARSRYLAKASRMKSRQLMASGGEEPVSDGGGGGHSVFARALIDALASMPEQVFTASELFEQKVKPAVIASASALTEGQTPGYHRIARAGDEPSSEFVFQAAETP